MANIVRIWLQTPLVGARRIRSKRDCVSRGLHCLGTNPHSSTLHQTDFPLEGSMRNSDRGINFLKLSACIFITEVYSSPPKGYSLPTFDRQVLQIRKWGDMLPNGGTPVYLALFTYYLLNRLTTKIPKSVPMALSSLATFAS